MFRFPSQFRYLAPRGATPRTARGGVMADTDPAPDAGPHRPVSPDGPDRTGARPGPSRRSMLLGIGGAGAAATLAACSSSKKKTGSSTGASSPGGSSAGGATGGSISFGSNYSDAAPKAAFKALTD